MVHIPSQSIPGEAGRGILCRCSLRRGGRSKCHRKPLSVITFTVMGVVSATVTICLNPPGTHSGQRIAWWAWKQTYKIKKKTSCGHFIQQLNKPLPITSTPNDFWTVAMIYFYFWDCYLHLCPETNLTERLIDSKQLKIDKLWHNLAF